MVDSVTNAQNLGSASRLAEQSLDLDLLNASDWTQPERVAYLKNMSTVIMNYPDRFTDDTLISAQKILAHPDADLIDLGDSDAYKDAWDSFWYSFWSGAQSTVGDPLVNVGNGASALISNLAKTVDRGSGAVAQAASAADFLFPAISLVLLVWLIKDPVRATQAGKNISGGIREWAPY